MVYLTAPYNFDLFDEFWNVETKGDKRNKENRRKKIRERSEEKKRKEGNREKENQGEKNSGGTSVRLMEQIASQCLVAASLFVKTSTSCPALEIQKSLTLLRRTKSSTK
jgi:hypothetical protein